jgi:hypothetical protein
MFWCCLQLLLCLCSKKHKHSRTTEPDMFHCFSSFPFQCWLEIGYLAGTQLYNKWTNWIVILSIAVLLLLFLIVTVIRHPASVVVVVRCHFRCYSSRFFFFSLLTLRSILATKMPTTKLLHSELDSVLSWGLENSIKLNTTKLIL